MTGAVLLALLVMAGAGAPFFAPNDPARRFPDHAYAPPVRLHMWDGRPRPPFFYQQRLVSRVERRFEVDRSRPVALTWITGGHLVTATDAPLLLLGADGLGRDIFSRVLYGARTSLGLAALSAFCAVVVGALFGAVAGYAGGWADSIISRVSEFLLVLPTMYVVLILRGVLPLVLSPIAVFSLLTVIFTVLGWPMVARGTRAIVLGEREKEYVSAARAVGASPWRLVMLHLLPAASGYLATQASLLVPAFILAEATLSYIGFGFPLGTATWGTMLQDTGNVLLVADVPWLLAPAAAIFISVLAINLLVQATGRPPVQLEG